jgi:MFS family permease
MEAMPRPSGPPERRNVYIFGATSFLNDVASEMAYWILPSFLLSIGAGPAKLGFIEGVAESVASFAKLFSGYLADRVDRRKPIVAYGYAVANIVKPALAIATRWWQVLIIRFADRTAKGIRGTARDVMLAESVEKEKLGSAFGLLQAMDSAGAIAGPLLALLLLGSLGVRGVFWVASVPGLACVLVFAFGGRETHREGHRTTAANAPLRAAHLPFAFYYVLAAVTLFSLGNSSDMFLVLRAQKIGIPSTHAPLLGLAFNSVYTLASWPAGKLSDRISKHWVAAAGYLVFALVYFVFAAFPGVAFIWVAMASYGLYYSLSDPVLRALVAQTVAPKARGRALGIYFSVTSIATLLASVLTGELWKHYSARLPFYISAGLALLAALMLVLARTPEQGSQT